MFADEISRLPNLYRLRPISISGRPLPESICGRCHNHAALKCRRSAGALRRLVIARLIWAGGGKPLFSPAAIFAKEKPTSGEREDHRALLCLNKGGKYGLSNCSWRRINDGALY